MEGNTPAEFYKNLPIFTRGIMTTIFLVTVRARGFGVGRRVASDAWSLAAGKLRLQGSLRHSLAVDQRIPYYKLPKGSKPRWLLPAFRLST